MASPEFRYESLFGKGFVSQAVPPAADDENKFHQDREAARFTAAEQPLQVRIPSEVLYELVRNQ